VIPTAFKKSRPAPALIRALPFLVFVGLTAGQGEFGEGSRYWLYALKTLAGAGMLWVVWPEVGEMRWQLSWDAVGVGVAVFVIWVGLDGLYPSSDTLLKQLVSPLAKPLGLERWCASPAPAVKPWNPSGFFSPGPAWFFVLTRLLGSSFVVPPLEEVFYRSFLYRYLAKPDFLQMGLNEFQWKPFIITAAVFGFSHYEWLPGIICGMLYHLLVLRHNRLGMAMTAHALTNSLLGLWIIWKGAWHFW
jgi:membrane protease YdiL (CAAX protease family)